MDYIIKNPDIYTEWRMSSTYRHEEEWAEEQYYRNQVFYERCERYQRLKRIKTFKTMNVTIRIPKVVIDIDDDDIPF